ncbi:MAG: HAD family hydrolase [Verrucomicrobia bacterium]|nr:HAD family hydrolase [Verrucomicrobiota bacterium]
METSLYTQNVVACIWDFDKTLIPGFMQQPLFNRYGIDEKRFWEEVNALPNSYAERGLTVSPDTIYLNHLLSYVRGGALKGLTNAVLEDLGKELVFNLGLPKFFKSLQKLVTLKPEYKKHDIQLEHYVISTGLAAMIRGSKIAPYVEDIYGCEFIEDPFPPHFLKQQDLGLHSDREVSQIGVVVDNTIKTRYIFEINKGCNKNPEINVNSNIRHSDRRVPFRNMIYIADGPSDIPVFSVVKNNGGKTFAVYDMDSQDEFAQNDRLLQNGRIHAYGPTNFEETSNTGMWLKMHVCAICDQIVEEREIALTRKVGKPPRHIHKDEKVPEAPQLQQETLFEEKGDKRARNFPIQFEQ